MQTKLALQALPLLALSVSLSTAGCTPANTVCNDPGVSQLSCLALRLTEGVSSKIDRVDVHYEINSLSAGIFTTRFDTSRHAPAKLPIDLAVVQPLNEPYTAPEIHVVVIASLDDSVVGTTSFGMFPPQTGTFNVSVPLVPVDQSGCFNGQQDPGEADVDCGRFGDIFKSSKYSPNVVPLRDRCIPCFSGSTCLINEDCFFKSCNADTYTCD